MNYSRDLLSQARALIPPPVSRKLPQASLRRAVSNAYYALFHTLTWEASSFLMGGASKTLKMRVQRSFQHAELKRTCLSFRNVPLAEPLRSLLSEPIDPRLLIVATIFPALQERRNAADYDMSVHFDRNGVEQDINNSEAAITALRSLRGTEERAVFLAALAFSARWSK